MRRMLYSGFIKYEQISQKRTHTHILIFSLCKKVQTYIIGNGLRILSCVKKFSKVWSYFFLLFWFKNTLNISWYLFFFKSLKIFRLTIFCPHPLLADILCADVNRCSTRTNYFMWQELRSIQKSSYISLESCVSFLFLKKKIK